MTNDAYLLLGSNISPERHLPLAVALLADYGETARISRVWESPPADGSDNPNYLNAAVLLRTPLSASELRLSAIAAIETRLGRVRDPNDKHARRTIDIDIALFNREILTVGHRRIPDPDVAVRAFALQPLVDIDPDYIHPESGQSLQQMLKSVSDVDTLIPRPDVDLSARRHN